MNSQLIILRAVYGSLGHNQFPKLVFLSRGQGRITVQNMLRGWDNLRGGLFFLLAFALLTKKVCFCGLASAPDAFFRRRSASVSCRFFFFVQLNTDFSEIYPVVQHVHDASEIPFVTFSSGNMHVIYCMHFRGNACILLQFFCLTKGLLSEMISQYFCFRHKSVCL